MPDLVVVHGSLEIDSWALTEVERAGAAFAAQCRAEMGAIDYQLAWRFGEPQTLVAYEVWQDESAYQAHRDRPHVIAWAAWIAERSAGHPLQSARYRGTSA